MKVMKESKAQIVAQVRNDIAKQYNKKLKENQGIIDSLSKKSIECLRENGVLKENNKMLTEKVKQLEEWNERLLEFMDSDNPKEKFEEYLKIENSKCELNNFILRYSKYLDMFHF